MIPCKLVHDTGTMIRFRPRQLAVLPPVTTDINLLLPKGRMVAGRFLRNPRNPNISGTELVRFIKRRIKFGEREDVLIEPLSPNYWVLHLVKDAYAIATEARVITRVKSGSLRLTDLASLLALADRESNYGRRVRTYKRILRPSGLRRLVIGLVGARCMVEDCQACQGFHDYWGAPSDEVIVDIHHIEMMARIIDHHPRNLCVLCANHHRLVHGIGPWVIHHDNSDIIMRRDSHEMIIRRPTTFFLVT